MTDNTNDIIHNITIEYLMNKQYHNFFKKDGEILFSINKRDKKFYKKRILNLTRDFFLNDDVDVSRDVKASYDNYIKHCIEYFKMLDKSDIIQDEYNDDKIIIENDAGGNDTNSDSNENNMIIHNNNNNMNNYTDAVYTNADCILFNKPNKPNTLDHFVKKIHIEENKIPDIIPRKRKINLKNPLLKFKGVNNGVNNNINNNYEKNTEKNGQECN
jgi:hypothetical protein